MSGDAPAPARVLIAEDEAHLGVLLEQFLTGRGHRVTLVRDGRAALQALQGGGYDVALTDVQMPGMDGLALLEAASALPLAPEVIVVTGNGAADVQLRALRAGAFDAVAKPYRMAELEMKVRRARERRAGRLHLARGILGERAWSPAFLTEDPATRDAQARAESAARERTVPLVLVGEPGTGRRTLAATLVPWLGAAAPFLAVSASVMPDAVTATRLAGGGLLLVRHAELLAVAEAEALAAAADEAETFLVLATVPGSAVAAWAGTRAVDLPPLRERPDDVPLLAGLVLARAVAERRGALSPEAGAWLLARDWPGNAAELDAVVGAAFPRCADRAAPLPAAALDPAR
ncbi:response regulator [Roseisolibacter sp. H3M3-2]|uniref:response regulator n=1 Tax=Roseisolibacter sp. H3M3-2 TaxID=3031323 RepID=UPI0023DBC796|nr:response regulator [Roseisolibacter sp. H3M3-2]MDF1501950.1 response regulator [Roseisolibacter sp. H3M3-2]